MANNQFLKYVERIAGGHNGPAWIAVVEFSASGKTAYFNNRALKSAKGQGIIGNFYDIETDEEYWISNPKKTGCDRHKFGTGIVFVHSAVLAQYLKHLGVEELDEKRFQVVSNIKKTNKERFHKLENQLVHGTKRKRRDIKTKHDDYL
jgi:hypothetical protein